jgi:hypothetical protein
VDMMLSEMSMSEYVHWQAFFAVELFPEERADFRTAQQLQMTMIAAGVKEPPRLENLMPDWWGERRALKQSPEQIKQNMEMVIAASKARKKRNAA